MTVFSIEQPIKKNIFFPSLYRSCIILCSKLRKKCLFSCYSPAFSNCFSSSINSRRNVGLENDNKDKKSDALTYALQNNTRVCKRSQSFGPGTSNRKLTVLCDSMECSRQQTSSADLHPTTTMPLFVPAFPSKSQAIQTSIGREKTCHISALFCILKQA